MSYVGTDTIKFMCVFYTARCLNILGHKERASTRLKMRLLCRCEIQNLIYNT